MATQQVKFHSVTAEKYNAIQSPESGSLYFITDNGEIRKGSQHVTGTRVYNAVDSTGITKVESLTITFGGTSITGNGFPSDNLPKKGDMLVVEHTLAAASGTEGESGYVPAKKEYAAYIYSANGGAYSASNWQACDGNVDASKVILTQNITMAGNYTAVGNFSKGTTSGKNAAPLEGNKGTAGVSVYELIRQMLSKTIEPTWQRNPPTASLSASSGGTKEQGEQASSTFTATLNDAYAKFDGGSNQMAGCSVNTNGYHFDGAETGQSGNTITKSWIAGVDSIPSASVTIDYKASTNTINNNLGEASTTISPTSISAGTTASASANASVTVIRHWFSGVDTDGTAAIDSAFIRNLTKEGSAKAADNHQFIVGSGAKRIVVAIPKSSALSGAKTLKNVFLVSASNTPLEINDTTTTGYKKLASPVSVADARGNAGYIDYDVWVYQPASISPTEEHNIVIG